MELIAQHMAENVWYKVNVNRGQNNLKTKALKNNDFL